MLTSHDHSCRQIIQAPFITAIVYELSQTLFHFSECWLSNTLRNEEPAQDFAQLSDKLNRFFYLNVFVD